MTEQDLQRLQQLGAVLIVRSASAAEAVRACPAGAGVCGARVVDSDLVVVPLPEVPA